jgi:hypothetical protein
MGFEVESEIQNVMHPYLRRDDKKGPTPEIRIFCSRRCSDRRISSITNEFILLEQVINLL